MVTCYRENCEVRKYGEGACILRFKNDSCPHSQLGDYALPLAGEELEPYQPGHSNITDCPTETNNEKGNKRGS